MATKIERYMTPQVKRDLEHKMAFVGGPRQVGKTTLALALLKGSKDHPAYFNWDFPVQRALIRKGDFSSKEPLIVLDEIHKYKRWRNLIKGLFDHYYPKKNFLVTGSARLDYYRRGGDSLQGRYHYYRLHPLSARELDPNPTPDLISSLLKFGGFPEPFYRADEDFHRRWMRERLTRVVYEDLRDLERVQEITLVETLLDALPDRVSSPLSFQSLREDLDVAHDTVKRWITILENLYVCFRVLPYGSPRIKAVKKESKIYFWDWSQNTNPGSRFENLVASQLLKYCHFIEDTKGHRMELRYLRDITGREVDFVVLKDRNPLFAVECKLAKEEVGPAVFYFSERVAIPHFYQVHLEKGDYAPRKNIRVLPFHTFCKELKLP